MKPGGGSLESLRHCRSPRGPGPGAEHWTWKVSLYDSPASFCTLSEHRRTLRKWGWIKVGSAVITGLAARFPHHSVWHDRNTMPQYAPRQCHGTRPNLVHQHQPGSRQTRSGRSAGLMEARGLGSVNGSGRVRHQPSPHAALATRGPRHGPTQRLYLRHAGHVQSLVAGQAVVQRPQTLDGGFPSLPTRVTLAGSSNPTLRPWAFQLDTGPARSCDGAGVMSGEGADEQRGRGIGRLR